MRRGFAAMLSLAPPVMATAVTRSHGLPAEVAGAYSGLVYAFVLLGNLLATPLIQRFGPLRLSFACVAGGALGLAVFAGAGLLVPPLLAHLDWSGTCLALAGGSVLAALAFAAASPLVRTERAIGATTPFATGFNMHVDGSGVIG